MKIGVCMAFATRQGKSVGNLSETSTKAFAEVAGKHHHRTPPSVPPTIGSSRREICCTISSNFINPISRLNTRSGFNRLNSYSCRSQSLQLTFTVNFLIMLMQMWAGKSPVKPSFDYLSIVVFLSSFIHAHTLQATHINLIFSTFYSLSGIFPRTVHSSCFQFFFISLNSRVFPSFAGFLHNFFSLFFIFQRLA